MYALTVISSIGAVQGVIILFSILLKFRHRKSMPLALLLIVFSLRLATIPTWKPEILLAYPWVYPLTAPLPFLFGFLLWWYIRELVSDTLNTPKYVYLHFFPYILEVLAVLYTMLSLDTDKYEIFVHNVFSNNPPQWLLVRNGLKVLINAIYLILCGRIAFSNKAGRLYFPKQLWLKSMVIVPSLVLITFSYVAVFPFVTERLVEGVTTPFIILSLTMAFLIYGISFLLLIAPEVHPSEMKVGSGQSEQLCPEEECEFLVGLVEKRFMEGAYGNPDLMLSDFAAEFKVHLNRLSYAINHCCGVSFRGLLNARRLDYFSARILEGAHKRQSILEIAFEAGFPSKSTFNRVFKEKMGITPSEYMKKIDNP